MSKLNRKKLKIVIRFLQNFFISFDKIKKPKKKKKKSLD